MSAAARTRNSSIRNSRDEFAKLLKSYAISPNSSLTSLMLTRFAIKPVISITSVIRQLVPRRGKYVTHLGVTRIPRGHR